MSALGIPIEAASGAVYAVVVSNHAAPDWTIEVLAPGRRLIHSSTVSKRPGLDVWALLVTRSFSRGAPHYRGQYEGLGMLAAPVAPPREASALVQMIDASKLVYQGGATA